MQPNQPQPTARPDMTAPTAPVSAKDLASAMANIVDLPKADMRDALDALGQFAALCLANGYPVRLPGLGDLKPVARPPRTGKGPDGQPYAVPARRAVTFRPSKALKDVLATADAGRDPEGQG